MDRFVTLVLALLGTAVLPSLAQGSAADEVASLPQGHAAGGGFYHDYQHTLNVQKIAFALGTTRGLSEKEIKFLGEVALLHDWDPDRARGAPPSVLHTLTALDADFHGQRSLLPKRFPPGHSVLKHRFGWEERELKMAKALIQRTEYPFAESHPNPAYAGESPFARYKRALGELAPADQRFVLREGAILSEYADKASYYMMLDFDGAKRTVEGLKRELRVTGDLPTDRFLESIGRPESFALDLRLANELAIKGLRIPTRDEVFGLLASRYKTRFFANLAAFRSAQRARAQERARALLTFRLKKTTHESRTRTLNLGAAASNIPRRALVPSAQRAQKFRSGLR